MAIYGIYFYIICLFSLNLCYNKCSESLIVKVSLKTEDVFILKILPVLQSNFLDNSVDLSYALHGSAVPAEIH